MADPAEFILAHFTGHMVATTDALNTHQAHWTVRDIFLQAKVSLVDLAHVPLTGDALMIIILTLKADASFANRAVNVLYFDTLGDHCPLAIGLSAIAEQWIGFIGIFGAPL